MRWRRISVAAVERCAQISFHFTLPLHSVLFSFVVLLWRCTDTRRLWRGVCSVFMFFFGFLICILFSLVSFWPAACTAYLWRSFIYNEVKNIKFACINNFPKIVSGPLLFGVGSGCFISFHSLKIPHFSFSAENSMTTFRFNHYNYAFDRDYTWFSLSANKNYSAHIYLWSHIAQPTSSQSSNVPF